MFDEPISICLKYGTVYGYWDSSELIGLSLVFDFNKLRNEDEDLLKKIFQTSNKNESTLYDCCLKQFIPKDSDCIYFLCIGILPEYQKLGFGSKLVSAIKKTMKDMIYSLMFPMNFYQVIL